MTRLGSQRHSKKKRPTTDSFFSYGALFIRTSQEPDEAPFTNVGWKKAGVFWAASINPLNAELIPICHLLVLLRDLTFMGPFIVSIFQYISNKKQRYTVYLYLETCTAVSRYK
jgi:hypothetical protein